jgi:hypothetical protein
MAAPFIYETARREVGNVGNAGVPIGQGAPVDKNDFAYGYVSGDSNLVVSTTGNKFQMNQIAPTVNGVSTTYAWTVASETGTTLTLTDNTTREVSVAPNASTGSGTLQCVATNAQASNSPKTVTYDVTVAAA